MIRENAALANCGVCQRYVPCTLQVYVVPVHARLQRRALREQWRAFDASRLTAVVLFAEHHRVVGSVHFSDYANTRKQRGRWVRQRPCTHRRRRLADSDADSVYASTRYAGTDG